jgi:hypothetical protein
VKSGKRNPVKQYLANLSRQITRAENRGEARFPTAHGNDVNIGEAREMFLHVKQGLLEVITPKRGKR